MAEISEQAALAAAKSRHKLRTVRAGTGVVICPYKPGACYSDGHYVPAPVKRWVQCSRQLCQHHHLPVIVKAHVPALVALQLVKPEQCERLFMDQVLAFRPSSWTQKIFELTAGVLEQFGAATRPDQLAVVWRDSGHNNGPLHFRWLDTVLTDVPAALAHVRIRELLPAIIHGEVCIGHEEVPLDNPGKGGIEHNSNSPTKSAQSLPPKLGDPDFNEKFQNFVDTMGGA